MTSTSIADAPAPLSRPRRALICARTMLLGLWLGTQVFAHSLTYHGALGAPLLVVESLAVYWPWALVIWAQTWWPDYALAFTLAASTSVIVISVPLIGVLVLDQIRRNSSRARGDTHGLARYANVADLTSAGLLGNTEGVFGGAFKTGKRADSLAYLRHNGPEQVLALAPTRSGKGIGLVLPTLLTWPHSALVADLKGELWALTGGWRHKHAHQAASRPGSATQSRGTRSMKFAGAPVRPWPISSR
jgi:type IV secretion system protein VirD4